MVLLISVLLVLVCSYEDYEYQIGTGIAPVSGPSEAQSVFMGYGLFAEFGKGVDLPLFARTVLLVHKNSQTRVAHVTIEMCFVSVGVKMHVVKKLKELGYGDLYNDETVMVVATHTHSDPGGYEFGMWYDMTVDGFVEGTFNQMVEGITASILQAHNNLSESGRIVHNSDYLYNCSINRSLWAYIQNPADERKKYEPDGGETDKLMTVLRFEDGQGTPLAAITYFAVHGTSMNHTNHIVNADNKGYASYLFEKKMWKGKGNFILGSGGDGYFVSSFPQPNHGDSTPNIMGALCEKDNLPCDFKTSTCKIGPFNLSNTCIGRGPGQPGYDMYDSTMIIGKRQYDKAYELFSSANKIIAGEIKIAHQYVDMNSVTIPPEYAISGKSETTCVASAGDAMLAGTTDGEGFILDHQAQNSTVPIIDWLIHEIIGKKPSEEMKKCHHPKPLAAVLGADVRFFWNGEHHPMMQHQLPLHMLVFGSDLVIAGFPVELTTMSGRRIREKLTETMIGSGYIQKDGVIIAQSVTNGYSEYCATWQEYQAQRYEGGSTLFGPHTLEAYIMLMDGMAKAIMAGKSVGPGPMPDDLFGKLLTLLPPVIADLGNMGHVYQQVDGTYTNNDVVIFKFLGSNPRSFRGKNMVEVYKQDGSDWELYMTDTDWSTRYRWGMKDLIMNEITVEWHLPDLDDLKGGVYKIKAYGTKKELGGKLVDYEVDTEPFNVIVKN